MEVPRITKITLNMGVGEAVGDKKDLENALCGYGLNRRPKACRDQVTKVDCGLQDS